jgi:Lrp/AsnC family leucine-responsive transcriptional regulator
MSRQKFRVSMDSHSLNSHLRASSIRPDDVDCHGTLFFRQKGARLRQADGRFDMDRYDWLILAELERDGRQPFSSIAEKVGLSKTPCWMRVQNLEQSGVITGYRAVVSERSLGLRLEAFCEVSVAFEQYEAFERAVLAHPAILECLTTAGDADYLLHVLTRDVESLDTLLREDLSQLPGVMRFSTKIGLKRIKSGGAVSDAAACDKASESGLSRKRRMGAVFR